jgi:TolA-binding protein
VKSKGGLTALLVLVVAALVATPSANAASTRAEYVSQAEAICSAPSGQLASIINQLNKVRKAKDLRPAEAARRLGKIIGRFATLELNILNQLATLTPAPGDEATVAQWLQGERNANALVAQAAKAGKHGNLKKYLRKLTQSITVAGQANQIVAGWGFQSCVF